MPNLQLINSLIYLDREYITNVYEALTGNSPETKITKTEGLNAGVKIPLFSGGANSSESRSYSISTTKMLKELLPDLGEISFLNLSSVGINRTSATGWVYGTLSVYKTVVKQRQETITIIGDPKTNPPSKEEIVREETYFGIHTENQKYCLITAAEYFSSGLDAFTKLNSTVIEQVAIPVRALIRVFAAHSTFSEWLAVPLIVLEDAM